MVALPGQAAALEPAELYPGGEAVELLPFMEVLDDPDGQFTAAQVLGERAGEFFEPEDPMAGHDRLADAQVWVRFRVTNPTDLSVSKTLVIERAFQSRRVVVYEVNAGVASKRWNLGYTGKASERPLGGFEVAWPCVLAPGQSREWLLQVEIRARRLNLQVEAWEPAQWTEALGERGAWLWSYTGLMLVMCVYHLILFISLRERSYLYFSALVASTQAISVAATGHLPQVLGTEQPLLNWEQFGAVGVVMNATWCIFTAEALEGRDVMPRMDRLLRRMAVVLVVVGVALMLAPARVGLFSLFGISTVVMITCISAGVVAWRGGYPPAKLYLVTWSVYYCFVLLQSYWGSLFPNAGLIESQLGRIGSVVQCLLFALVLAERYALMRRMAEQNREALLQSQSERLEAQEEALRIEAQAADTLQRKVEERTAQLAERTTEAEQARAQADHRRRESESARLETEVARMEAELAKCEAEVAHVQVVEADEQKTRFFQNMSHELRTPLTLILSPLAAEAVRQPDNENLEVSLRNARRLLRLVNQLLDFQKLRAGKLELKLSPLDVAEFAVVTTACFRPLAQERNVSLEVTVEQQAPAAEQTPIYVRAEIDALEKVVFNYLSNALKFTPDGGHVVLDLSSVEAEVVLSVRDDGPGIALEHQDRLFKTFSQVDGTATREHEGTGLGLALVKQLVEAMDGEVGVDSAPGEGSRFWAKLCRVADEQVAATEALSLEEFSAKPWLLADGAEPRRASLESDSCSSANDQLGESGPRILVVDDLADMRLLIGGTLRDKGYRISMAERGDRAFEQALASPPDLILTDWMMPGLSGPELIEKIRITPSLRRTPVVLLTAKSDVDSRAAATVSGADAFLGKPFDEAELCASVRNLLDLKSREREVESLNQKLVEQGLARCLPPALVEGVLKGELELTQKPTVCDITVLSVSLCQFDQQMRVLSPRDSGDLLNLYLQRMTEIAFHYEGVVDQFVGDRMQLLFGVPNSLPLELQLRLAIGCAFKMLDGVNDLVGEWAERKLPAPALRLGLHQGEALVGTFGGDLRADYTAIGEGVSLAEKLSRAAKPGTIHVLTELVQNLSPGCTQPAGRLVLQGETEPRRMYALTSSARSHGGSLGPSAEQTQVG